QQQTDELEEVLVPAHRDAVLGDAAEPSHYARIEWLAQFLDGADRTEARARPALVDTGEGGGERLGFVPLDGHHCVPVVHQMVCKREAGWPEAYHEHGAPARGSR